VPAQVDDLQRDIAHLHGVAVAHQLVGRHRELRAVFRARDGLRPGGTGDRAERLPVVAVPVGGDDRAQIRPIRAVPEQVQKPLGLVRRVDQQRLPAGPAHQQIGVVVHRADRKLGDAQRVERPPLGRPALLHCTVVVLQDLHSPAPLRGTAVITR
jgi:hypothetical protein